MCIRWLWFHGSNFTEYTPASQLHGSNYLLLPAVHSTYQSYVHADGVWALYELLFAYTFYVCRKCLYTCPIACVFRMNGHCCTLLCVVVVLS